MKVNNNRFHLFIPVVCSVMISFFLNSCVNSAWEQDKQKYLQSSRNEWNHRIKRWREVANWSFDDNKMPESFQIYSGNWEIREGQLCSVSGKPDRNRAIKITNCAWPAFRFEFDVVLKPRGEVPSDRIGDIGISFNADPETGSFAQGYAFITSQYFNQATVLYRLNIPYARTEWSPVIPGKKHHIMIEVVKPHLRLWIDGRVVLEGWERRGGMKGRRDFSDFMDMDPKKVITLHTYDTIMKIDNMRIFIPETK